MSPEVQEAYNAYRKQLAASYAYSKAQAHHHELATRVPAADYDLYIAYTELAAAQHRIDMAVDNQDELAEQLAEADAKRIGKGIKEMERYLAEQAAADPAD